MRVLVLILGLVVLVLGIVGVIFGGISGAKLTEEITRTFYVEAGKELKIQSLNGRITFEEWDEEEVKIEAVKQVRGLAGLFSGDVKDRVTIQFTETERGVEASANRRLGSLFMGNITVQFNVLVPRGWTGDISLVTSNGPIYVSDVGGNLNIRTSNGRIELSNVDGVVQARTSNGSIRAEGTNLTGTGQLRTSNGSISLNGRLDPRASYDLTTSNGPVSIALAEPNVSVDLTTSNGRIDLRTEVTVSRHDRRHLVGRIGEGTATLNVRTSNGSISLVKVN